MPVEVVQWMREWQTLIGALIGAGGALMVALVVARAQERRERRTAAAVLNIDLVMAAGALTSLEQRFPNAQEDAEHVREWAVRLLRSPPALSPLFDAEMARLLGFDDTLDHHLAFFRQDMQALGDLRTHLLSKSELLERFAPGLVADVAVDAYDLAGALQNAGWHARHADALLHNLLFRRQLFPRRLWRNVQRIHREEIEAIDAHHKRRASVRNQWIRSRFPAYITPPDAVIEH